MSVLYSHMPEFMPLQLLNWDFCASLLVTVAIRMALCTEILVKINLVNNE